MGSPEVEEKVPSEGKHVSMEGRPEGRTIREEAWLDEPAKPTLLGIKRWGLMLWASGSLVGF